MLLLMSIVCTLLINISCSNSDDNEHSTKQYPLTSFSVKIGVNSYEGKIDQSLHKIFIKEIEDPDAITDVNYTLIDNATISPDPKTFIGTWRKEQQITVTTKEQTTTIYTVVLTDYKEILFQDNFDIDGKPDPAKWISICRDSENKKLIESTEMVDVKDGSLFLVADKFDGIYKEGRVETRNRFWFTYGTVEVRARVTRHPDGNFPAIWMMPQKVAYPPSGINTNPISGEIDIMEHVKQFGYIHQTVHSNYTYNLKITNPTNTKQTTCNIDNYNIYGMKWTENEIIFYVNGQKTFSYPNLKLVNETTVMQWPFRENTAFYLIMNMALSRSDTSWVGPIDDVNLPAIMEIDWVRIYK